MMKISVVLTTKNEEKNIGALLESLINQEEPFEVIVIDSNSTDRTQEIVKNYSNNNKMFHCQEAKRGQVLYSFRCEM